jgi:ribose 5-phosphate isomerase A
VIATLADSAAAAPRIGLGSGSTSFLTLLALSEARRDLPPDVALVATSYEMEWYATAAGFPVVDLGADDVVVAFDGADQVDPEGALIKGRGGAMHRERVVLAGAPPRRVPAAAGAPARGDLRVRACARVDRGGTGGAPHRHG